MSQDSQATQPMDSSESSMTDVKDPVPSSPPVGGGGGGGGAVVADADADMDGSQAPIDHALWTRLYPIRDGHDPIRTFVHAEPFHFSSGITGVYRSFGMELLKFCSRRKNGTIPPFNWKSNGSGDGSSSDEKKKDATVSKKRKGEHEEGVHSKRLTSGDRVARPVTRPVLSQCYNPRASEYPDMRFAQICDAFDNKEIVSARRQMKRLARVAEVHGRCRVLAGVTIAVLSGNGVHVPLVDANSFMAPTPFVVSDDVKNSRFACVARSALRAAGNPYGGPEIWDLLFNTIIVQYAPFGLISNPSPAYCLRALAVQGLIVTDLEMFIEAYYGMMSCAVEPTDQSIVNFVCPGCLSSMVGSHLSDCPIKCLCIHPVTVLSSMRAQVAVSASLWDLYMFSNNIVTWLYAFYNDLGCNRFSNSY